MKKAVIYISSLVKDGAERVAVTLSEYLQNTGEYEMVILTDRQEEDEYDLPKGVKRINIGSYEGTGTFASLAARKWRLDKIKEYCVAENPDIIIGFMKKAAARMMLATKKIKCPKVGAIRSNPAADAGKEGGGWVNYVFGREADLITCQTYAQRDYFPDNIKRKTVVIPNPISAAFQREPFKGTRENVIVTVGRLNPDKNQKLFIEAFSKIADEFKDVKAVIYGEGELRKELETQIAELHLGDRISMPGNKKDIADLIYKAKMFAFSSDHEGMPNALIEAMAMGLPVATTQFTGGAVEMLLGEGVNSILVPRGNANALADAMRRVLTDTKLAESLGKEASKIRFKLEEKTICEQWKKSFDELIDE